VSQSSLKHTNAIMWIYLYYSRDQLTISTRYRKRIRFQNATTPKFGIAERLLLVPCYETTNRYNIRESHIRISENLYANELPDFPVVLQQLTQISARRRVQRSRRHILGRSLDSTDEYALHINSAFFKRNPQRLQ
jgi:hypothetical protein